MTLGRRRQRHALGVRHVSSVRRNEHGTKFLSSIFDQAQDIARHNALCYVNCDILLMSDFIRSISAVATQFSKFLVVGQRWDTDVREAIEYNDPQWQERLRKKALAENHQRPPQWIDYFAFSRGLYYQNTPPFVMGVPVGIIGCSGKRARLVQPWWMHRQPYCRCIRTMTIPIIRTAKRACGRARKRNRTMRCWKTAVLPHD